ncbi:MAG: response regulator, partial [Deltaproteobacteria bacterium]|nr:response regulator [Deltaproteobacteria bacterium]
MSKVVLVADDSKTIRTAVEMAFGSNTGYETISAPDGSTALKLAKDKKPDVVLADHKLPGLDGYDLLAAMKQETATSGIPFIVLTSIQKPFDKVRGVGADGNISKPFLTQELLDMIDKVIESSATKSTQPEEYEIFIDAEPPDSAEDGEEFDIEFPEMGFAGGHSEKPTTPVMPAFNPGAVASPKPSVPVSPASPKPSVPVSVASPKPSVPVSVASPKPSVPVSVASPKPSVPVSVASP